MHILTYCDEDLGVAAGGSRQVLELSKALVQRGHAVTVVAPESERGRAAVQNSAQLSVTFVPVVRWGGLRPLSFLWGSMRILNEVVATHRPDVLLWFDSPGQMAPLWVFRNNRCPIIYFVNGLPLEEVQGVWRHPPFRGLLTHGLRLATRKATALVSVCPEVLTGLETVEPLNTKSCSVIRNGVDLDHFFPQSHEESRGELGLISPGPYVGFVGGFFPWHGLDTLIEALALVVKAFPTVRCLLVGDGETRASLEALVRELGLSAHVYFPGRVDFDMVPKWIAASDVCVVLHRQTRSYPGDSMKLWEYLACGRPVVATAGPGYGQTVEELQCGVSVKADDPSDLARQLGCLLGDHHLRTRMGDRGRAAVVRRHTWSTRAEELERVFYQTVTGMKAAA